MGKAVPILWNCCSEPYSVVTPMMTLCAVQPNLYTNDVSITSTTFTEIANANTIKGNNFLGPISPFQGYFNFEQTGHA